MLRTITTLAATGLLALGVSPTAHADETTLGQDQQFYTGLMLLGLDISNPPLAKQQGLTVCTDLSHGFTDDQVITALMSGIGYTFEEAASLVAVAVYAFCPEFDPAVAHPMAPA